MRVFFAFAIAVLLTSIAGYALEITVPMQTVSVPTSAVKSIPITVSGHGTVDLNILDEKIWTTLDTYLVTLDDNGTATVALTIAPTHAITLGLYKISLVATELDTGESRTRDIFIHISKGDSIIVDHIFVKGDPEPLGTLTLSFSLSNVGEVPYKDALLYYTINASNVLAVGDEPLGLNPGESTTINQDFVLARGTPPGTYEISAIVTANGKQLTQEKQFFTVSKKPVVRQEVNEETGFLVRERSVTIFNHGNDAATDVSVTDTLGGLASFFFLGTQPTAVDDNIFTWRVASLDAGEAAVISYRIDYTPLLFFAVAIVLAGWYVFARSRKLVLVKRVLEQKRIDETTTFTVGITVHNKSGRVLDNVLVSDVVPPIFKIGDAPGMKPQRKKTESGTEVRWKLSGLKKGEERVLTYKITPVFGVNGVIRLPPAHARYTSGKITLLQKSRQPTLGMHMPAEELAGTNSVMR